MRLRHSLVASLSGILMASALGCGGGSADSRPEGGGGKDGTAGTDDVFGGGGAHSGATGHAGGGTPRGGASGASSGGMAPGGAGGNGRANDCTDAFTEALIAPSDVSVVTPIGLVGGGGTEVVGRSYIFPREGQGELALHAPTSMKLVGGTRYLPPGAPDGYHPDWALAFQPDCSSAILIELYHVKNVAPAISEVLGDEVSASSAWRSLPHDEQVHLDAGDAIGGYVHGINSVAFDFIVKDDDVTNEFAEPARYADSNVLHVVCPYRYYTPALRSAFEELLGAPGTGPVPRTTCGSVALDVTGALAGQWFLDPDVSTGRGNISLEGGYGNPHAIGKNPDQSITFGNIGPSHQGYRLYRDASSWVDPAEVTDRHCYQLASNGAPQGWLYYVLASDTEMQVFHGESGECPSGAPTTGGKTYYR